MLGRYVVFYVAFLTIGDLTKGFQLGRRSSPALYAESASERTGEEFSRSLSTKESKERFRKELAGHENNNSKRSKSWRNRLLKPFRKVYSKGIVPYQDKNKPGNLILLECGESTLRKAGIFTGWADPPLTPLGIQESEHAARLLLEAGYEPDVIYSSVLKRALQSTWIVAKEMDCLYLPVLKSWRLNERMYGAVQGLSKTSVAQDHGENMVQSWRNNIEALPPPVSRDDPYHPRNFRRYDQIDDHLLPLSESLYDCMERTRPLWEYKISRQLCAGNNVLVVGHSNSLRGLAKIIDDIPDAKMKDINFPPGIPVVYKFDKNFDPIRPEDGSLTQIHTSGAFLEKPGILEIALERLVEWKESIPGEPAVKRWTTLEESLFRLKVEKDMEKWAEDHYLSSLGATATSTTNLAQPGAKEDIDSDDDDDDNDNNGDFEEDVNLSKKKNALNPSVVPNVDKVDVKKDSVVVLVRHGTTPHNELALFTGWEDPPLALSGVEDAKRAGRLLKQYGFEFDVVYTSWLTRAIETAWLIMEQLDTQWLPIVKSWRLNERHYGALTGKSKKMIGNIYGQEQLKKWRRGFDIAPPPSSSYSFHYPGNDYRRTKYVKDLRISFTETFTRSLEAKKLVIHRKFPKSESLKMCMERTIPFYTQKIVPEAVDQGKRVLITSHENAIRGILMHLCEIPVEHMNELHIPNGLPLVYNVRRRCISLLDDESGNPVDPSIFGSAAQYLFRPCEILNDDSFDQDDVPTTAEQNLAVETL